MLLRLLICCYSINTCYKAALVSLRELTAICDTFSISRILKKQ